MSPNKSFLPYIDSVKFSATESAKLTNTVKKNDQTGLIKIIPTGYGHNNVQPGIYKNKVRCYPT